MNIHQNMTLAMHSQWALDEFTSWPQLAQGAWGGLSGPCSRALVAGPM